jgi:transposase
VGGSLARLVITAVVVEGCRAGEVAATYKVARSWVYELVARYRSEGDAAFEPRSRRPHTSPRATLSKTAELIVQLRGELVTRGLDAGADTIAWHLREHHHLTVSPATIYRTLRRAGLTTVEPKKRPRSSYIRFQADLPNECWQGDFTHWRLADGSDVEILCWLDDHSRYAMSVTAHRRVTCTVGGSVRPAERRWRRHRRPGDPRRARRPHRQPGTALAGRIDTRPRRAHAASGC